jgi:hypothetical protein
MAGLPGRTLITYGGKLLLAPLGLAGSKDCCCDPPRDILCIGPTSMGSTNTIDNTSWSEANGCAGENYWNTYGTFVCCGNTYQINVDPAMTPEVEVETSCPILSNGQRYCYVTPSWNFYYQLSPLTVFPIPDQNNPGIRRLTNSRGFAIFSFDIDYNWLISNYPPENGWLYYKTEESTYKITRGFPDCSYDWDGWMCSQDRANYRIFAVKNCNSSPPPPDPTTIVEVTSDIVIENSGQVLQNFIGIRPVKFADNDWGSYTYPMPGLNNVDNCEEEGIPGLVNIANRLRAFCFSRCPDPEEDYSNLFDVVGG